MKNVLTTAAMATVALMLSSCEGSTSPPDQLPAAAPISEADAARIADATVTTWASMDAAKIKALYAPGIVGFDYASPALSTDRATWDRNQDLFAAEKFDNFVQRERKIQVLDADTFVMSGIWDGTSTAKPTHNGAIRCTDVFEKSADAPWSIVNEHCSPVPNKAG